jgi:hypothetical protein
MNLLFVSLLFSAVCAALFAPTALVHAQTLTQTQTGTQAQTQLPAATATTAVATKPVTKTECTAVKLCYCVNPDFIGLIDEKVALIRKMVAEQRAKGKAVGYLSIPLSTAAGGYFNVNDEIAQRTKALVETRFGSDQAWLMNPAMNEATLTLANGTRGANAEYMLMWTRVLEGVGAFGDDFDFVYFTGPTDFAGFFGLTGKGDMDTLAKYFEERVVNDKDLKSAVDRNRISKNTFRNYYALRASVAFSAGASDEWNIVRLLNERRRGDAKYGVPNQIPVLFDGKGVETPSFIGAAAVGSSGACAAN